MTLSAPQSRSSSPAEGTLRILSTVDLPDLTRLLDRDPSAYCVVAERIENGSLEQSVTGGQCWGWFDGDDLQSAIYVGANIIPIETDDAAREAFADRLAQMGRRSSAIVGYRDEVLDLWRRLSVFWSPAREVRADQPLLRMSGRVQVEPDSRVRLVTFPELDLLLPAAIAMFTEEVGVSPVSGGRAASYRARLGEMVRNGRSFARIEDGEIVFKAEIGSQSRAASQLQGVWVAPELRGTGVSEPGLAAVVELARHAGPREVSLYANRHNTAALAAYARIGFEQIGTFATVLF